MTLHKEKSIETWVPRTLSSILGIEILFSIPFLDKENNNGAN